MEYALYPLIILVTTLLTFSGQRKERAEQSHAVPTEYADSLNTLYHYTEGIKQAYVRGDLKAAGDSFAKAVESDSTHAPSYFELAKLMADTLPELATFYIDKAVKIDSTNLNYKDLLGRLLITTQRYDGARKLYNRLVKEAPHNPNNYRMLAALYEYDGQPFTAIALIDSAEYKFGKIGDLSDYKRKLLIKVRMYDKAIEETRALIADYPHMAENYLIMAELYGQTNNDSLAIYNYNQALQIDSTRTETLLSLAEYHHKHGRNLEYLSTIRRIFTADNISLDIKKSIFDELTADTEYYRNNLFVINSLASELMVRYPADFSVTELYATHLIRIGEIEQALALYKSFIENRQASLPAYFSILDIETHLQRPDSVAKYSARALEQFPDNSDIYIRKGYALQKLEREKEALQAYRMALKFAQTDSVKSAVLGTLGDLYYQKNSRKAFATYTKALEYDADNSSTLNNFAYFLSEEGKELDKAYEMSMAACRLRPGNSTFLDTQGWILYLLGRYDEAKKIMQQALALDSSGNEVLLLHYGDILYALGDEFMAQTYWRRALNKGYDKAEIEQRLEKINNR